MKKHLQILKTKINQLGLEINDDQLNQFCDYYEMLIEKNKVMNLTAIVDPLEVIDKHFVDSLSIVSSSLWKKEKIQKKIAEGDFFVIDIGTGAGFPGIPLKIMFPEISLALLDSLNKRILFLQETVEKLGFRNVECIHGRSEDFARKQEYREQFDLAVSRAVAKISSLSELCLPFVKQGGYFIAYKASNCEEELAAAEQVYGKLGGDFEKKTEITLPETEYRRVFAEIKKVRSTPKKYPRRAGLPVKEPLS